MTGVAKRAAARRVAMTSAAAQNSPHPPSESNPEQPNPQSPATDAGTTEGETTIGGVPYFKEHRIDSIIYEHDEEYENPKSGTTTPGSAHSTVTRTKSVTEVYKTNDEKRVIVVCHDEGNNIVECDGGDDFTGSVVNTPASMLETPASLLEDTSGDKKETGSLLIQVSDKLNAMPKHHRVTLSNSIPTDQETLVDSLTHKYRTPGTNTPDSVFTESEIDDPATPVSLKEKRHRYERHRAALKSLDDSFVGNKPNSNMPDKEFTLSVPNLHTLTVSGSATPSRSTPRISHSPRLVPKPSPRLSPRLAHTVHNVKRKISEAVKHEMSALMVSDAWDILPYHTIICTFRWYFCHCIS